MSVRVILNCQFKSTDRDLTKGLPSRRYPQGAGPATSHASLTPTHRLGREIPS